MEDKDFIEQSFQKLLERGWLEELIPSAITETDIAGFEKEHKIKLPAMFKAYLMAYKLPCPSVFGSGIDGLIYDYEDKEIRIDTIDWYVLTDDISDLSEALEGFREEACEWDIPARKYKNMVPFGYMDGWYCLDLKQINGNDCPVVFLGDDDDWEEHLDKKGYLHGKYVAPNFRTLLEWFFCGSLEPEYEKINHVTVNYEFYKSWHNEMFIKTNI